MATILDFHIQPDKKDGYGLQIFERGSSQPLLRSSFNYELSYITQFEINHLEPDPKDPQGRMERIKEFGKKLYDKLFTPDVQKLWADYKQKSDFLILCLRLSPKASSLEVLPWETLYDGEEFLSAGAKTSLSRLPLDIEIKDKLPPLPAPLKMLALVSSPLDLKENERLQIEKEQEILLQAVNTPSGQGKLLLEFEDEAKLPIIESSLEGGCQIFHYSGHGISPEDGGGLLLEDAQGNKRPTSAAEVLQTLQKVETDLRLAVISGCQTARTLDIAGFRDMARGLMRRKIPAVIAMQFSISDYAGLVFAENLYPRLIEGKMLELAVSAARRALLHTDDVRIQTDAFAPVLFLSNSQPLQIKGTQKEVETTAQPKIDFSFHLPLPQLSFGFYGRRKEYRAIRDGLLHKNHRAIIVHGIGGIGKTALISHTATRLREHFKGIYAFDCTSAALAPETILLELHRYLERQGIKVLGELLHQSIPPDQLAAFIAQVLSQLPLLIIFDNFESHLANKNGGHEIVDENLGIFLKTLIKTTATGTRFLFTTRYLFDIDAKRIGDIQELPLDDLSIPEAIGLMLRLPHLSSASYQDKLGAFEKFGGHPYALVTLDQHCSHRPLTDVLDDATKVHAELREFLAIELSYSKLSERSRELLNRLAAFRKPVPLNAAEWVMGKKVDQETTAREFFRKHKGNIIEEVAKLGEDEFVKSYADRVPEVRETKNIDTAVSELIGWGLLTPIEKDGEVKMLSVHSLVRDFCKDKQKPQTWNKNLRDAAAYYTNQTKLLRKDDKTPAAVWAEMEAFELLFEAGEFEDATSLLIKADTLLDRWGFGRYLEWLYMRVIPKLGGQYEAVARGNLANILQNRGEYEAAINEHKKVRNIFRKLGDLPDVAISLHQIGIIHENRGDYDKAQKYYEKSLKIFEVLGDRAKMARSYGQMGNLQRSRGDYESSLKKYIEALKIFEELGDRDGVSRILHQIGIIHQDRGNYDKALIQYEKSLKILEELGNRAGVSSNLHQIGMIYQDRGDYDKVLEQYEKSLKIDEELGDREGMASSRGQMGRLFIELKKYAEAFGHFLMALSIFDQIGSPKRFKAASDLKKLRGIWGAENFDKAWREKTGKEVPEELKTEDSGQKTEGR